MSLQADPQSFYAHFQADGEARMVKAFAFSLDTLGTSAGSKDAAEKFLALNVEALAAVQVARDAIPDVVHARWYTDNVLVAGIDDFDGFLPVGCAGAIAVAAAIQLRFAIEGLFMRGGGAWGALYADADFLYGESLVAAHNLESKVAFYPRVILSHNLAGALRSRSQDVVGSEIYRDLLCTDFDGMVFVDYLAMALDLSGGDEAGERAWLARHRDHVRANLAEFATNDRVRLKYQWLASYHDRFVVSRSEDHDVRDLLIDADADLPLTPFITDWHST